MSTDLEVRDEFTPSLFGTTNPVEARDRMMEVSQVLVDVVRKQNLVVRIQQSDHLRVEAWTFLGSILGVFPVVEWSRPVLGEDGSIVGYEARVEARTRSGEVVGAAESVCLRSEKTWKGRDDYALKSMAQTRAVSKAMRGPLGFVVVLAGFNPTPAEEMPSSAGDRQANSHPVARPTPGEPASPAEAFDGAPLVVEIPMPTAKTKKYLDVLVTKLTAGGKNPRDWIRDQYPRAALAAPKTATGDWRLIREALWASEASSLIKALEGYVVLLPTDETGLSAPSEQTAFPIPASARKPDSAP